MAKFLGMFCGLPMILADKAMKEGDVVFIDNPPAADFGGEIWQAKADALGDACCRELERVSEGWK